MKNFKNWVSKQVTNLKTRLSSKDSKTYSITKEPRKYILEFPDGSVIVGTSRQLQIARHKVYRPLRDQLVFRAIH